MERVRRPTLEKDIDIVLLTGLSSQYDAEVLMLESSADWPDCAWIERVLCNQFDRIRREKSEVGPKHPLVVWYRLLVLNAGGAHRGELQEGGVRQTQTEVEWQARQRATTRRQSW